MFPGAYDTREFWERARDRNRATADALNKLGLPEFYVAEAYVTCYAMVVPVQNDAVQNDAVQNDAVQYRMMQYRMMQYRMMQYRMMQYRMMQYRMMQYRMMQYRIAYPL